MAKIVAAKNETKKEFIIKKAASLFRKKGFVGSSMREIAEIIGVRLRVYTIILDQKTNSYKLFVLKLLTTLPTILILLKKKN